MQGRYAAAVPATIDCNFPKNHSTSNVFELGKSHLFRCADLNGK
jgi:hypothetical protein